MHRSLRSSSLRHGEVKVQSRNTPRVLVPAIVHTLGGAIDGDPCANVRSVVPATCRVYLPRNRPRKPVDHIVIGGSGLEVDWWDAFANDVPGPATVFCNPPWGDLGAWIDKIVAEAQRCEIVALLPLRPHRRYWGPTWGADGFCFLEAVEFEGFTNKLPLPCIVLYWGRHLKRFRAAWAPWGHVLTANHTTGTLTHMPMPPDSEVNPSHVRLRLLSACLPLLGPNELLEAIDVGLAGATYGEIWALIDDIERTDKQAAANLQNMVESMPFRPSGTSAPAAAKPQKRTKKKKAPTNAKKRATKAKPKNGAAKNGAAKNGAAKNGSLSPEQLDAAIEQAFLRKPDEIRTAAVAEAMGVSKATALRAMQRLEVAGKVKLEGSGRGARYLSKIVHSRAPVAVPD
jgi:hypothetical protein